MSKYLDLHNRYKEERHQYKKSDLTVLLVFRPHAEDQRFYTWIKVHINALNDNEDTGQPLNEESYNFLVRLLEEAEYIPKRFLLSDIVVSSI